jgi:hypothetical protein
MDEVCKAFVPTVKRIPRRARARWAEIFSATASRALHINDHASWTLLAMFAKCTTPTCRGGKNAPDMAAEIVSRLNRWAAGQYFELWQEALKNHRRPAVMRDDKSASLRRAEALTREGELSRAFAALTPEPMAPKDIATRDLLQMKHPPLARPIPVPDHPNTPVHVTPEEVAAAVRTFSRGSSAGTMGLRAEYLKDFLEQHTANGPAPLLARVIEHMANGRIPLTAQPSFSGAALNALKKKDGSVRPIAAGEVLRRLTAKCLCRSVKEEAASYFAPYQFGVAAKCGTERVVHKTRAIFESQRDSDDFVFFKVDLSNAFNNVSRAQLLDTVSAAFPTLRTWMQWCYGQSSDLTFGEFTIKSDEGAQQGDPLGPTGFAASLHPIVLKIAKMCPELLANLWFLDDGNIGGKTEHVLKAIEILQTDGPHNGMFVNFGKCEIHCHPAALMAALNLRMAANHMGMSIPLSQVFSEGNMLLLGSPIGSPEFSAEFVDKECVRPTMRSLEALRELRDPQVALTLLRNCTGYCAFVHALRTTPPSPAFAAAAARFDEAVLGAFDHFFGPLPQHVHQQVRMATRGGGIGLRSAADHHTAAYAASVAACARLDGWEPTDAIGYSAAVSHLTAVTGIDASAVIAKGASDTQRELSRAIDDAKLAESMRAADIYTVARLRAQSGPHAGAWLSVLPSADAGFAYTHKEYTTLVRWWLGLPVYDEARPCRQCGSTNDREGYHALTCRCWGGRIYRHHALANVLVKYMQCAHHNPRREVEFDGKRPADVYLPHWHLGKPLAIDLAVTHPLQRNALQRAGDCAPGSWASEYAREHKEKQAAPLAQHGVDFAPLVVETFGSWDPAGYSLLHECASQYAVHQGIPTSLAVRVLFQRLSVTLMRINARMILARDTPPEDDAEKVDVSLTDGDIQWELVLHPDAADSPERHASSESVDMVDE